jgi:hypothetical protein
MYQRSDKTKHVPYTYIFSLSKCNSNKTQSWEKFKEMQKMMTYIKKIHKFAFFDFESVNTERNYAFTTDNQKFKGTPLRPKNIKFVFLA